VSGGEGFLGKPAPKGFRVRDEGSFARPLCPDGPARDRDPSANEREGGTRRVQQRLDRGELRALVETPEPLIPALGETSESLVRGRRVQSEFDQAFDGAVAQIAQGRQTPRQQHEAYLAKAQSDRAQAEAEAKTAKAEQRAAKREAAEAKLEGWLESKTDEQVSAFLSSETFAKLPEESQDFVHRALDRIAEKNQAEVDVRSELDDWQLADEFELRAEPYAFEELRLEDDEGDSEEGYQDDNEDHESY
jgi:hypothetical protein